MIKIVRVGSPGGFERIAVDKKYNSYSNKLGQAKPCTEVQDGEGKETEEEKLNAQTLESGLTMFSRLALPNPSALSSFMLINASHHSQRFSLFFSLRAPNK